jgi:hypothetical protein
MSFPYRRYLFVRGGFFLYLSSNSASTSTYIGRRACAQQRDGTAGELETTYQTGSSYCRSNPHRPRRSRRAAAARRASSSGTARALSFPVLLTRHVSAALVRLWLRFQRLERRVAAEKPQNQE